MSLHAWNDCVGLTILHPFWISGICQDTCRLPFIYRLNAHQHQDNLPITQVPRHILSPRSVQYGGECAPHTNSSSTHSQEAAWKPSWHRQGPAGRFSNMHPRKKLHALQKPPVCTPDGEWAARMGRAGAGWGFKGLGGKRGFVPKALSCHDTDSTGMTGKSSGRGTWDTPKQCQMTGSDPGPTSRSCTAQPPRIVRPAPRRLTIHQRPRGPQKLLEMQQLCACSGSEPPDCIFFSCKGSLWSTASNSIAGAARSQWRCAVLAAAPALPPILTTVGRHWTLCAVKLRGGCGCRRASPAAPTARGPAPPPTSRYAPLTGSALRGHTAAFTALIKTLSCRRHKSAIIAAAAASGGGGGRLACGLVQRQGMILAAV